MIGLCGSHRTGKTTLAEHLAESLGLYFLKTHTSDVVTTLGYDSVSEYDFDTRLKIQNAILEALAKQYESVPQGLLAITDRTPMDVLMYTTAEIGRGAIKTDEQQKAYDLHRSRALDLCHRHLLMFVRLQPGIIVVDAAGKAPPVRAYMDHLNAVLTGLLMHCHLRLPILDFPAECVDLPTRLRTAKTHVADILLNASNTFACKAN